MTNPPASQFPPQPVAWSEVARLCRRICLLRECGQAHEAEDVRQGALHDALIAITAAGATEEFVAKQLDNIFAAEAERVANAAVLAELLRPLLGAVTPVAAPVAPKPAPPEAEVAAPESAPAIRSVRAAPADISSFIDDMLAQERTRSTPPPIRRVS